MNAMPQTTLGRTGPQVSRLGLGGMRFQMTDKGLVDREIAVPLLRRAVELGITYFDTAVFYCNSDSQRAMGEAFEGLRDKVVLSTKNHLHASPDDEWWRTLEDSLRFLRTGYLDIYNFHGMTWDAFTKHIDGPNGKLRLMVKAREQGLVRHICCSFHDTPEALVKLAETGIFTAITLQYNLLNRSLEQAMLRLKELGVGVVVMGPVGGGRLGVPSDRLREATGDAAASTPEIALRFVLGHPAVSLAISGMNSMAMLDDNVRTVTARPPFTPEQVRELDRALAGIREKTGIRCPACGYCQPCPAGVDISENFRVFNEYRMFGLRDTAQLAYRRLAGKASACTECGACLAKCPQRLPIPDLLVRIMSELDTSYDGFGGGLILRGAVDQDHLRATVVVRNLTSEPIQPAVRLALDQECVSVPDAFTMPAVPSLKSASREVALQAPDGVGCVNGVCTVESDGRTLARPFRIPFFIIPRGRWRRHVFTVTPATIQDRADMAARHGMDIHLMHDGAAVMMRLDVRSAMHAPSPPGAHTGGRVELYVDMRPPGGQAPGAYGEGAEQFVLTIDRASAVPLKHQRSYGLEPRHAFTDDGFTMSLSLPFRDFMPSGVQPPATIGLDLLIAVADANGVLLGYPTYSGRAGLYQNPRLFARAYLL